MNKNKIFLNIWKKVLIVIFILSGIHLIRDILQDIFDVHNTFTEFLHYELDTGKLPNHFLWTDFAGFRRYVTFPVELFLLIAIPKVYKKDQLSLLDLIILVSIVATTIVWLIGYYFVILN